METEGEVFRKGISKDEIKEKVTNRKHVLPYLALR